MAAEDVGWLLAAIVLLGNAAAVIWFLRRRSALAARIDACDPGLLNDPGVRIETITDAPDGSMILPHRVAVPLPAPALDPRYTKVVDAADTAEP